MAKRKLEPFIPEDQFKAFVGAVIAVPKTELDAVEATRQKRTRKKVKGTPPKP